MLIDQLSYSLFVRPFFLPTPLTGTQLSLVYFLFPEQENTALIGDLEKNLITGNIFTAIFNLKGTAYIYLTKFINVT